MKGNRIFSIFPSISASWLESQNGFNSFVKNLPMIFKFSTNFSSFKSNRDIIFLMKF